MPSSSKTKICEAIVVVTAIVLLVWVIYIFMSSGDRNYDSYVDRERISEKGEHFDGRLVSSDPEYGLRGDKLIRHSILQHYIRPDRHIRLSHSGAQMWESNYSPVQEGIPQCKKVDCPTNADYDTTDSCYKCGDQCRTPMPEIYTWPHTRN